MSDETIASLLFELDLCHAENQKLKEELETAISWQHECCDREEKLIEELAMEHRALELAISNREYKPNKTVEEWIYYFRSKARDK